MKKYILLLAILVLGMAIGWSYRGTYYCGAIAQRDTIFVHDTIEYTKEVLAESTKIVHQKDTEYIYIEVRDTIEKEKKVYVPMPRQYYYTNVNDVEIWHSGIDSTIDSLNVVRKSVKITDKYMPKNVKNHISLGMEVSYYNNVSIPIYFEYERLLHKNIGIYGRVGYDLSSGLWGVGGGARLQICW